MGAIFRPWTNTLVRVSLGGALGLVALLVGGAMLYARSPFDRDMNEPIEQPVQFDHRHHTRDVGIDCRFCHDTVERSPRAGIPSTATCLACHAQVWNKSPLLDPVRAAYFADKPIPWQRVHRVPDYVYFDHSIHVNKGVGCVTCHGRVDGMAAVEKVESMTMAWCLDCHRAPERHLRPREMVAEMEWAPKGDPVALGRELAARYDVKTRTSCTTCHR